MLVNRLLCNLAIEIFKKCGFGGDQRQVHVEVMEWKDPELPWVFLLENHVISCSSPSWWLLRSRSKITHKTNCFTIFKKWQSTVRTHVQGKMSVVRDIHGQRDTIQRTKNARGHVLHIKNMGVSNDLQGLLRISCRSHRSENFRLHFFQWNETHWWQPKWHGWWWWWWWW